MLIPQFLVSARTGSYHGIRMKADEYFALGETQERYQLIDGVVVMSPSPTPLHQSILLLVAFQIKDYLEDHPVGEVFVELDVNLGSSGRGGDLVYRPDVMFFSAGRLPTGLKKVNIVPDLVVEVGSPGSRLSDHERKKADYERAGVREYWIIDPEEKTMTFMRMDGGRYVEIEAVEDTIASEAVSGFKLKLTRIRAAFATE